MASYQIVTGPSSEPITLSEAKLHLRVDGTDEDSLIQTLISSARQMAEAYTWRPLMPQTWKLFSDRNEVGDYLILNKAPVTSIVSVSYKNDANAYVTLSPSAYETDLVGEPARIKIINHPVVSDKLNAWCVEFQCGYSGQNTVPDAIKAAIKLIVAHLYEHREDVVIGTIVSTLDNNSKWLLDPYRMAFYY